MAFYESNRALREIEDSRVIQSVEKFGLERVLMSAVETTIESGFTRNVDRALRLRRIDRRRRVIRNPRRAVRKGQLVDMKVTNLAVGVMPFLYFADLDGLEMPGAAVAFWAHATVESRRGNRGRPLQVVMLGSLDNLPTRRWSPWKPGELAHDYPSEPGFLSRIVAAELRLTGAAVAQHVHDYEDAYEPGPGERAEFAWGQTTRATYPSAVPGTPETWIRERIHSARVVAEVCDVQSETYDGATSVLLARPVLIQNIS
jgi:hypothetical protein